jgi:dipeptidyl aminopeptidase/acylaminoacyl peptidase
VNYDHAKSAEIEQSWIYRHDLTQGTRTPVAKPEKPAFLTPLLNQSGSHILYSRKDRHPAGRQICLVDIEGKADREILNFGESVKSFASWFPDGENILVLSEIETYRRLGVFNRLTEQTRWLIDDPNRNIETAFVPKNADQVVVIDIQEARTRASLLDPITAREQTIPETSFNQIPLAPSGKNWVSLVYGSKQPRDLIASPILEEKTKSYTSLTRVWDQTKIAPEDLVQAEDFRWISTDHLEIQGWLYKTSKNLKGTVVMVHGGPTYHSRDQIDTDIQFLASHGFNVLDPNYRGSTGFSLTFQESIKEDGWGGKEQDDIIAGVHALIAAGIAQPGRIGITGVSYGGYSAWCAITRNPLELIAAAAPVCGMTDLVIDYETTRPDLRPFSEEMIGGTPDEIPEKYFQRSPINFINNIKGRLLIIQGLQDPNVSPENVNQVRKALDQAGVHYEVLAFEDEGHGIFRPKNLRTLYLRLAEFFQESLGSE